MAVGHFTGKILKNTGPVPPNTLYTSYGTSVTVNNIVEFRVGQVNTFTLGSISEIVLCYE